jgi:transcriptional regulator GlxA family with amidase domain
MAQATARELVVYHRRAGGQSQFSTLLELEPPSDRIRRALQFAREHLHEGLPVERLAAAVQIGPRQFSRVFLRETGETPAKAVERLRAEVAQLRVAGTAESIEVIAQQVGFLGSERMRRAFIRLFGQPPQALRRIARQARRSTDPEA